MKLNARTNENTHPGARQGMVRICSECRHRSISQESARIVLDVIVVEVDFIADPGEEIDGNKNS